MGISVHAYALRLHLVFRLLCAQRHLHLQEMQWHFDSFLRRCVKVTSRSINWKMGLEEGFNVQIGYMRRKIQDKRAAGEATEEMVYDKLIRAMKMDSLFCSGRKIYTFYPETLKSCSTLSVTMLTSNKLQQTVWTLCLNSVISGPAPGNVTHPSPSHLALAFMPFSVFFFFCPCKHSQILSQMQNMVVIMIFNVPRLLYAMSLCKPDSSAWRCSSGG